MKIKRFVMIVLALLPLAVTVVMLFLLPGQIPAHYNGSGEITRWGSKYELLIMPVFTVLFIGAFYSSFCRGVKAGKEKLAVNAIFIGAIVVGTTYNFLTFDALYRAYIAIQ